MNALYYFVRWKEIYFVFFDNYFSYAIAVSGDEIAIHCSDGWDVETKWKEKQKHYVEIDSM